MPKPSTAPVAAKPVAFRLAAVGLTALALGGCFGTGLTGMTGSLSALTAPPAAPTTTPVFVASTRPA
ncbi:MAG: hypothetical protein Q8S29_10145, partial [Phreatobacter sp.]|nr:hypothetical protein [Phreatobacter sp.]